jgi:hypothetical protein
MFRQRNIVIFEVLILSLLFISSASASVIDGPTLSLRERMWGDAGLIIQAEVDVNLVSVLFPNQGQADNIQLVRVSDWTPLASIPVPAGDTNATVDINYPLAAHEIYVLFASTPSNKYFGYPDIFTFPTGNPEITVLGSYYSGSPIDSLWLTFNKITTEPIRVTLSALIDIKPGSDDNSINLKSKGVVPVAILTTEGFDASSVDVGSVKFAGASPVSWQLEDVDGDGNLDLLLHFRTQELTDLSQTSTSAVLTGAILDGTSFTGADAITIVPKK